MMHEYDQTRKMYTTWKHTTVLTRIMHNARTRPGKDHACNSKHTNVVRHVVEPDGSWVPLARVDGQIGVAQPLSVAVVAGRKRQPHTLGSIGILETRTIVLESNDGSVHGFTNHLVGL